MTTTQVLITGNTYPVRDEIKALGGKWNPDAKGWEVPADKADEARKLVDGAPKSTGEKKPYRPTTCKICGCRGSTYNRIYRNGVCRNCYIDEKEERMGY